MTTITSIGSQPASTATPASSTSTATTTSNTAAATNPVLPSSYSTLSKTAVQLSLNAGIVASLPGSTSTTPLYTAVGLLNSITQAGAATNSASTQGVSSTTNGTSNLNSNWASILAATPQASSALTADTANQTIIATL